MITTYLDVLLRFVLDEPVPGHEPLAVFIDAALLAAEVDCDAEPGEWLADTVTFHETLLEMRVAGEQPRDCFRHFAWQLGMLADFGLAMRNYRRRKGRA